MQSLDEHKQPSLAFLSSGFRPFFFCAGLSSGLLMLLWAFLYRSDTLSLTTLPAMLWHGHEMVYGYCLAVIAGFLLTATKNWTGIQTVENLPLAGLALLWLAARLCPFIDTPYALWAMAAFDLSFMIGLLIAVFRPIWKTNNRQQFPIIIKLGIMILGNFMFYWGALMPSTQPLSTWGLYLGFYLILSLIMMMGRRVIPFFIEGASPTPLNLSNWKWLDLSSMVVFLVFMIIDVFLQQPIMSALLAGILFLLHLLRLVGWYHISIFKKPLLWVLYLGYAFIVLGFAMKALTPWLALSPWLALHAFAVGGIGLITTGMMARVALGHTGRSVMHPSPWVGWVFLLIATAAIVRVLLPIIIPAAYVSLITLSQVLWVMGYALFTIIYMPVLLKPAATSDE